MAALENGLTEKGEWYIFSSEYTRGSSHFILKTTEESGDVNSVTYIRRDPGDYSVVFESSQQNGNYRVTRLVDTSSSMESIPTSIEDYMFRYRPQEICDGIAPDSDVSAIFAKLPAGSLELFQLTEKAIPKENDLRRFANEILSSIPQIRYRAYPLVKQLVSLLKKYELF